jgi:hypothetical protein
MRKRKSDYSLIKFDQSEMMEPDEHRRINDGRVTINFNVFKKTPEDRKSKGQKQYSYKEAIQAG